MSKAKLLMCGWICLFLIGCGSTVELTPTVVIVPSTVVHTPQSDGGTDVIVAVTDAPGESEVKPTATAVTLNTVVPAVSATSTPTADELVPTPGPSSPIISGMLFFDNNDSNPADQFTAPNEVFVQFNYANIPDGAVLKRDWYFNNALFISREEAWDGATYGKNGIRNDISIFDYETSLAAGVYQLNLSIDGVEQANRTFVIVPDPVGIPPIIPADQKFFSLYFRGIAPFSMEVFQHTFEQPNEVFAEWSYRDMADGDLIRRDWYLDNELFISKDEIWDIDVYGSDGLRDDVSIFDFETGLTVGEYRIELFVNGVLETNGAFTVVDPYILPPLTEPISGKQATSESFNIVVVRNPDGSQDQIAPGGRLQAVEWILGGDRMIISTKKLVEPTVFTSALAHVNELWLWDIAADSLVAIGSPAENFQFPVVSPDGETVAVLAGSGYGDACVVDLRLVFLKISGQAVSEKIVLDQFAFTPAGIDPASVWAIYQDESYQDNLVDRGQNNPVSAGVWLDNNRLRTTFGFSDCSDNYGDYEVNLDDFTAKKVE